MDTEPQIHSFYTDCLPENHPWAHETVICGWCGRMVHAGNNECMQEWVEWGGLALCFTCAMGVFAKEGVHLTAFLAHAVKFPCVDKQE